MSNILPKSSHARKKPTTTTITRKSKGFLPDPHTHTLKEKAYACNNVPFARSGQATKTVYLQTQAKQRLKTKAQFYTAVSKTLPRSATRSYLRKHVVGCNQERKKKKKSTPLFVTKSPLSSQFPTITVAHAPRLSNLCIVLSQLKSSAIYFRPAYKQ